MSDHIDRLASLSGLRLDEEERERLRVHLAALQSLIDALPVVKDESVSTSWGPDIPLRSDEPGVGLPAEVALDCAASRAGDWLDSPPVREEPA
jgi:Asp-tRNA(Asn)/Glu-tRNA(Gln) amidotransferase C subunit